MHHTPRVPRAISQKPLQALIVSLARQLLDQRLKRLARTSPQQAVRVAFGILALSRVLHRRSRHPAHELLQLLLHRPQAAAKELLEEDFGGFVTSDRYAGYHFLDVLQQQLCWAHATCQLAALPGHQSKAPTPVTRRRPTSARAPGRVAGALDVLRGAQYPADQSRRRERSATP